MALSFGSRSFFVQMWNRPTTEQRGRFVSTLSSGSSDVEVDAEWLNTYNILKEKVDFKIKK
jgi:hypothetical protein